MLLMPNGAAFVEKTILPLSRAQIEWFVSSEAFLRNLEHLPLVGMIPYCAICAYAKQRDEVSAVWHPETEKFVVRSTCRGGEIPLATVRTLSLADLLLNLGWRLRCGRECQRLNLADGVEGNNDLDSSRLSVACGCTERLYVAPAVGRA